MTYNPAVMAARLEPADSLDFFPTPPWAVRALVKYVLDLTGASVWEPACGAGHMVRPLAEYARHVVASDIDPRFIGWGLDFLETTQGEGYVSCNLALGLQDWIVTNPPFNRLLDFIRHGLAQSRNGVAMLCPLRILEGIERHREIFEAHKGRFTVAPFVERLPIEAGCCAADTSTATAYCWLVIDKHQPRPPLVHIPPCRKELERVGDYDPPAFVEAVRAAKKAAREAAKGG